MKSPLPDMLQPPKWADRFLEWYCHPDLIDEIQGDLTEKFQKDIRHGNVKKARMHYSIDVIKFFRPSSFKNNWFSMNTQILFNYLKVSFRVLKREKSYTFTNIFGLTLGLACSLFIYLWVQDELKYNQWPDEVERIHYVMANHTESSGLVRTWHGMPFHLKEVLEKEYPGIEQSTVVDWGTTYIFKKGDAFLQQQGVHATPDIFEVFSIPFLTGSNQIMFDHPQSIAISENMAERYYGEDWKKLNILGQEITEKDGDSFKVAGVYRNIDKHSMLTPEFVLTYAYRLKNEPWMEHWGNFSHRVYVKLVEGQTTASANQNVINAIKDHRPDIEDEQSTLLLQPFGDRYLYNRYENGQITGGRIDYVRLLTISAILIIILASVNFINLTTSKSIKRAKETGVRKVLGAMRTSIRWQFIIESTLITFCSFACAIVLTVLLLPEFRLIVDKEITWDFITPEFVLYGLGLMTLIGIISGIYPALYMSALNPVSSMKGIYSGRESNALLKNGLVIVQFAITIIMIAGSLTVHEQLQYIFTKNIGINRDNVVLTLLGDANKASVRDIYKQKLLESPGIKSMTTINEIPYEVNNSTSDPVWDGKDESQDNNYYIIATDPDFIPTMEVELVAGRNFDWNMKQDTSNYIINETAAKMMQLEDPIGVNLEFWEIKGKIIGVVEDFHLQSLHQPMEPLILRNDPDQTWRALTRIESGKIDEAIASLERLHNEFDPARTFKVKFLDDDFNSKYENEQLVSKFSLYFTLVAISICCLGLLGLVAFRSALKTKEIGIRKVLGASLLSLIKLVGKEFFWLSVVAFVIASPIAYWIIEDWLSEFAYRIDISLSLFVISGVIALAITLVTVINHALRSAMRNPVDSLRNE